MPVFTTESGIEIYYDQHGQNGPAIVLVHGLASSGRIWFRQKHFFHHRFRVYSLDLPGHGKSPNRPRYSLSENAELMRQWMDACGIESAHVIALSLGCSVALTLAENYPDRVESLALCGPIGGFRSWWDIRGWQDRLSFAALPIMLALFLSVFGKHQTAKWLNTYGVQANFNFKMLEHIQNQSDFKAVQDLLWDSAMPPYVGRLHQITAPTLVLRGAADPVPKRFVDYIVTSLAHVSFVEIPCSRHLITLEHPHFVNRLLARFISGKPLSEQENEHEHRA